MLGADASFTGTPANCSRFWYDTPEAIQRVQYPGIAIMDAIQRFLERY